VCEKEKRALHPNGECDRALGWGEGTEMGFFFEGRIVPRKRLSLSLLSFLSVFLFLFF